MADPADPDSPSYQGYPTVGSVDDVEVVSPTSGGTLTGTTLTMTNVLGASAYAVRVAASEADLGTTNLYEKSDYATNVLDISAAPILDSTTYYWQSRATKDGTTWGSWTAASSFTTSFQPAATPTFSPPGGTYTSDQSVTISCATSGATIFYTTDGSAPTTSSSQDAVPISVAGHGAVLTIKALATTAGHLTSSVGIATFTISYPATTTPTFSPPGGVFTSDQSVTISCASSGATINYTTDGSDPASSGTRLSGISPIGPITAVINSATTIRAIATTPLNSASAVGSATYRGYAVGDTGPAGGIVFYDEGSYTNNGWRWLEAAPSDQSTDVQWYNGSYVPTGATFIGIGSGDANTTQIVLVQGAGTYAASICANLSLGGCDDWFLPSMDDLNLMYGQKEVVGGFASDWYWSSSQSGYEVAWSISFDHGGQYDFHTDYYLRVRAVRAF